jgi:hypothetical protein
LESGMRPEAGYAQQHQGLGRYEATTGMAYEGQVQWDQA